ncbi:hypothetical protein FRC12_001248 [Ceratobasidium sp. 428]|nr:hypothetical protein FRC12_001248 [Ceratobasidium sp. 428]
MAFCVTATGLRQCWPASQTPQMTITCLEWHELVGSVHNFILFQLISSARKKPIWLRLGRRSRRHSRYSRLKSVTAPALPLDRLAADDYAIVSYDRDDLSISWRGSILKNTINEPIPFLVMLDVLDLAHSTLEPNGTNSSVYASFIMGAIHEFGESASTLSGNSSRTQSHEQDP